MAQRRNKKGNQNITQTNEMEKQHIKTYALQQKLFLEKFKAINGYIKKRKRYQIHNFTYQGIRRRTN